MMHQLGVERIQAINVQVDFDVLLLARPSGGGIMALVEQFPMDRFRKFVGFVGIDTDQHIGMVGLALFEIAILFVGDGDRDAGNGLALVNGNRFAQFFPTGNLDRLAGQFEARPGEFGVQRSQSLGQDGLSLIQSARAE